MADPDASQQMVVVPEREQLTMAEAQRIGNTANRLARLRRLRAEAEKPNPGKIMVGSGFQALDIQLGSTELAAALAHLIERDEQFLASFNVKLK